MSHQTNTYITPEEYLEVERRAEYKNEYFDGVIYAMVGASRRRNLIGLNVGSELRNQLRGRDCETYVSDMRVKIQSANLYTYPDVAVVCGQPRFEDAEVDTLLNPTLVVEVLSKSTASYDRTTKFGYYRTLESLAEYLLIAQDRYKVEQYTKQPGGKWLLADISSPESVVELTSVGCTLALKDIYERVEF
jgi:Uma2 family endonuclease